MSNPATPKSGMPKWLIILLVLFLLIIMGCCGGFVACRWACNRAVSTVGAATQKAHDEWAAATQAATDATQKAAAATQGMGGMGGNGMPTKGPDNAAPGDAGGNPPTVSNGGSAGGNPPSGGGTGGGGSAGGGAATPVSYGANNLPTDIPVMSGMTSTGISTVDRVNNSGGSQFSTKSSPADVTAYYQKQFASQGWTLTDNVSINGMTSVGFSKGTRKANVMAMPADGSTMVTITFEAK